MKRPLVLLTFAFCLGIIIASKIRINFTLFYLFATALLITAVLLKNRFSAFLLLILPVLLGALVLRNSQILPACHISKLFLQKSSKLYNVQGIVASEPFAKNKRTSFIFKARQMQLDKLKFNCRGNILVSFPGGQNISYGDELILRGRLYRPFSYAGNSRQSYRNYLYAQGIYALMNAQAIVKLNKNSGFALKRFALSIKSKMEGIISQYAPGLTAGILEAMVLGEKKNIPSPVTNSMMKSGTVHILVVSGFNVGIVAFMIMLFLKLLRLPKPLRLSIAILCLVIYCLITGASNPVVRATVMGIFFLLALLLKREPDIYNSLSLAAIFILAINPRQLFDIGFQLSFVSVFSIVYLYPRLKKIMRLEFIKIKPLKIILEGCLVSLSAWLGTMGFIAYYFKIFSPVTVIANIFIVPLATLITLSGLNLILIGFICPPLAYLFTSASEFFVVILLKLNFLLIKLPGAYFYLS